MSCLILSSCQPFNTFTRLGLQWGRCKFSLFSPLTGWKMIPCFQVVYTYVKLRSSYENGYIMKRVRNDILSNDCFKLIFLFVLVCFWIYTIILAVVTHLYALISYVNIHLIVSHLKTYEHNFNNHVNTCEMLSSIRKKWCYNTFLPSRIVRKRNSLWTIRELSGFPDTIGECHKWRNYSTIYWKQCTKRLTHNPRRDVVSTIQTKSKELGSL